LVAHGLDKWVGTRYRFKGKETPNQVEGCEISLIKKYLTGENDGYK